MHEHSFTPLLVVVGSALVAGLLLPRLRFLRIPLVVGEILVGIALGRSGIGLIPEEPDPWLELLSLFGFAFLMFLSGLEIDFRSLSLGATASEEGSSAGSDLRRLLMMTFGMFFATLVTSLGLSWGLVAMGYLQSPYIMALIMSTTSVGLVMPLLKERAEASTSFGQAVIVAAVIADFTTMLLITVVVAFYEQHGATLDVLVVGTIFILFFVVLAIGRRLLSPQGQIVRRLAIGAPRTAQLPIRAAMTLMLGFVVFSQLVGSEIILGAFLAGTVISSVSRKAVHGMLGMKLDAIGFGFFIPIFFIMVGARFDLHSVLSDRASLMLVPILVTFAFLVKVVPSLLLAPFFGRRHAVAAGFVLSSRLSLIIAASAIGLRLGVITPEVNAAIIIVAVITCLVSPLAYAKLRGDRVEAKRSTVDLDALIGHVVKKRARRGLELQLVEVEAEQFPFLVGRTLADANLRQRTGLTLLAIAHPDGTVDDNPGGSFRVRSHDRLYLVGTEEQVSHMESLGAPPGSVPHPQARAGT